jgi:hypothetical protein
VFGKRKGGILNYMVSRRKRRVTRVVATYKGIAEGVGVVQPPLGGRFQGPAKWAGKLILLMKKFGFLCSTFLKYSVM